MDTYFRFTLVKYRNPRTHGIMSQIEQVTVQERVQAPKFIPIHREETRANKVELLLRKIALAALTVLGIGYILGNAPVALLIGYSVSTIPIASQANISAIAGKLLFLMASIIATLLGAVFIFGAVQFYERSQTRGVVFLGVLLGSFCLLCLGVGSTLLLSETNFTALLLIVAPILVAVSAASHASSYTRFRIVGSVLGIAGGVTLAYAIFNFRMLDLVFAWDVPFTGPFMALTVLESVAVILGSVAASVSASFGQRSEERPFSHVFVLLVALVYGLGAFIGSLVLSMSFWDFIWKSPWVGPLHGVPEWVMNLVIFWSASLVLMDIGGILLIAGACLGFVYVAQEFAQL